MTFVVDKFRSLLPPRTKTNPSGWTSFNAPCCQHRGHSPDTRKRAGVRFDNQGIVYNCFNCKFTTGWQPGTPFGEKIKSLCRWLGGSEDDIKELIFQSLKTEATDYRSNTQQEQEGFEAKSLPEASMCLSEWTSSEFWQDVCAEIEPVIDYVHSRGHDPFDGNFYWSPLEGYKSRVIIPFRYQGKIVGNTARKITNERPKYLSDQPPRFVFNIDQQRENQRYVFVIEGPFDALSVGGVALLTNEISDQQARIIEGLSSEIILIPDQDPAGLITIKQAMERGWSVAFPTWADDVKDVSDAVKRYGRLFVTVDAIKTAHTGNIKITMMAKKLENKLVRLENEKNS
jgi:hypothetical protein